MLIALHPKRRIYERRQSVTSVTIHVPISDIIDCPHNISTVQNEQIVLLIMLLL